MNVNLKGKWALVTGASRGVGVRIAEGLAQQGCHVVLHARSIEATNSLAEKLRATGANVVQVAAELSDIQQVKTMIEQVKNSCQNQLSILYCNAAIMTPWTAIYEQKAEDYNLSFQVNCTAPIKLADAFIPAMVDAGFGRVVMVTSGIADQPQLMAYSCSKAALDRYVRDMVQTVADTGVLINLADPGWLTTDLGGPDAPNHPDSVLPGILVPVVMANENGSGKLYAAQELKDFKL